jgi:Flp pilus assembly protein CpaB
MSITKTPNRGEGLRKMLSTRKGTAMVAAICTLLAGGILLFAALSYRQSVAKDNQTEAVLVARTLIQKGTSGSVVANSKMFQIEHLAGKQVSPGAVADASALRGKVAASDINPGQQLTLSEFATGSSYASDLAPNQRAISIALDTSHGLTGVLRAGERVDLYAGVNLAASRSSTGAQAEGALRLLVSNVPVMAVSLNATGGIGGGGVTQKADVLLKIPASDAGAVALASDNGNVWLILRGPNAQEPAHHRNLVVTVNSLMMGAK